MNLRLIILLILLALLTACGGQASPAAEAEQAIVETPAPAETGPATVEPEPTDAPATVEAAAESFPVTIEHKYGRTEITQRPERIVAVGLTEQDVLLALGIVPVGTTEWFGEYPGAIWPWAQEKLGDAPVPELVGDASTINFEKLAALKPDLILALYAGVTQEQYDLLTQIAPTVAQPGDYVDYGIPWQELTRTVGQAVGQAEEADRLVTEVEARFEQVRAEHPEFVGATSIVATPYEGIWVYGGEDVRGRFLTALGFKLPEGLAEITGEEFGGNLSFERADLLDVDVIIWLDADEAQGPLGGPVYQNLAVHTEGREVFLDSYDDPLGGATSFVSVLSLPFLLDGLVPKLAAALDKLPAADVPADTPGDSPRVVTLTELDLDSALALGVTPVGSVNGRGQQSLPAYLGERVEGIESVGSLAEPSLEKILALNPDLILVGNPIPQIEALLPELEKIAPVAVTFKAGDDWQTAFKGVAAALKREAEAEKFMAEYKQRVEEIKALLPAGEPVEASVTRWMPEGPVVMVPTTFSSLILADVGLTRPAAHAEIGGGHGAHSDVISLESLDVIDGDWLFIGTLNAEGTAALDAARENPLFQQLKAVQNERVVIVDGTVWTSIGGPLAALQVLADVEAALAQAGEKTADAAPAETNPAALDCAEGFRPFDHELLASEPLCLPIAPQRIVALDIASLELALLIGQPPVVTSDWMLQEMPLLLPQYADTLAGIEAVGYPAELEKILLLKPDIILAPEDTIDVEQARAIAPLVVPEQVIYDDWKLGMQFWSEVLNVPDFYAQMEANYNARVAELQAALGQPDELEVSVISASTYGLYLWMPDSPPGAILADVGLARPEAQSLVGEDAIARYGEKQYIEISEERLDLADGDALFYFTYASTDPKIAGEESAFIKTFEQKPLWQTLNAVKAKKAFFVPGYWWRSQSYLLANKVIDDLFTYLTDTEATTPTEIPFPAAAVSSASTPKTRLIQTVMGEIAVPVSPQRVVVLDTGELDNTLALGVKPVGAPLADAQEYQGYLTGQLDGISEIGPVGEPSLEAILALKPDLILGSKQRHEAIYPQLAEIAPTVFVESLRVPWQDNFRLHAEALGKSAEAEQLLADYEAHVAETQKALGDKLDTTISIIRFRPDQVRLYLKGSFIGYILQDVGLKRPPAQDKDEFATEISLEQIADVDADYIFLTGYNTEDSDLAKFMESELWTTLNAVKAGQVEPVDDDTWISGLGIQAANHVLDDLVGYLTKAK